MQNRIRDGYPYNPPRPGRLAARHTLLAEVLLGWQTITLGVSGQTGGDGTGLLHQMLLSLHLTNTWGYYFIAVGYLMLQNAGVEFFLGRNWGDNAIGWVAGARRLSALGSMFAWLIVAYLEFTTPLRDFRGMVWMVPINFAMSAYFFWETTRVHFFIGIFSHAPRVR